MRKVKHKKNSLKFIKLEGKHLLNSQSIKLKYPFSRTTISEIIKQKSKLLNFMSKNQDENVKRRRMKKSTHHDLEEKLFEWYSNLRANGDFVNGPMIASKASEIHEQLGTTRSFSASNGWLEKFKARYGIKLVGLREVKLNNDSEAVEPYTNEIQAFLQWNNLSSEQVYNADETDLFWRMTPNPDEKETSKMAYRDRVTLLCCTNATGSHKLPLVCVGKRKHSRLFNSSETKMLPVIYFAQETAWMDQEIFQKWFHENFVPSVQLELRSKGLPESAILFIDQSSSHPSEELLKSQDNQIFCYFLPKNVKNLVQPMEQGIFSNLKRNYRRELVIDMIKSQLLPSEFHRKIMLKDAIMKIKEVWDSLSEELIMKSFSKIVKFDSDLNSTEDPKISNKSFEDLIRRIPECEDYTSKRVLSWLNCDEAEPQRGEVVTQLMDEDVIDDVDTTIENREDLVYLSFATQDDQDAFPTDIIENASDDEFPHEMLDNVEEIEQLHATEFEHEETEIETNVTCQQALNSLNTLLHFMQNDSQSLYKDVVMLQELHKKLTNRIEK